MFVETRSPGGTVEEVGESNPLATEVGRSSTDPAADYFAIVPDDAADFATPADSIFVGGAGDVVLVSPVGSVVTFAAPAGIVIPAKAVRVNATGTTATGLVGLIVG